MSTIKGAEYPLYKVLSSDFEFHIPDYQRPYAWTREQASELFEDISGFKASEGDAEKYFLGSIVLVKSDDVAKSDVVDGQQRVTTLTLLLAAIAAALSRDEEWRGQFDNFVREPGQKALKLAPKPRLFPRKKDQSFFEKYVQTPGGFPDLLTLDPGKLSEPRRNMVDNARHFAERLAELAVEDVGELGQFIVNNCYMVVVTTDSFHAAYRIFSVLNDRGLELEPSDILKARIIARIEECARPTYTELWEDLEEQSGRKGFNELLGHVRMVYRKEKARRSQLEEFEEYVVKQLPTAEALIDDVLKPYAEAFEIVRNASYESTEDPERVNRILEWLQRLNNQDWMPVAMLLLRKDELDMAALVQHLGQLERLAGSMFIRGVYATPRMERYGKVLAAIERGNDLSAEDSPLNLTAEERQATLDWLDGRVYTYSAKLRSYILLRLDSFLAGAGAVYKHTVTTIEHVLPQTVATGSEWDALWSLEDRELWTNRLGNLVLLSRAKNAEAQNYDFAIKKTKYFQSKSGVSPYASTTQVLSRSRWTVAEVEARQQELLDVFRKGWQLGRP
jgi:hypothetical protein